MRSIAFAVVCLPLCLGCGQPKYQVSGTITLEDGSPLAQSRIHFHPTMEGVAVSCIGSVAEGKYVMGTTSANDGVPAGEYKVTIDRPASNPDRPTPIPFDAAYTRPRDTPLTFTVEKKKNEFNITLKKSLK